MHFRRIRRTKHRTVEVTKMPKGKLWTVRNIVAIAAPLLTVGAVIWQIESIREQNEAIMYSNRPILNIRTIKPGDIKKSPKYDPIFIDGVEALRIYFTLENNGVSPAYVDSISISSITDDSIGFYYSRDGSYVIASGSSNAVVDNELIPIFIDRNYSFKIIARYEWRRPKYESLIDSVIKCYSFALTKNGPSLKLSKTREFNDKWRNVDVKPDEYFCIDIGSTRLIH
ncbi:MAG: hypothetical protein ABIE07_01665 [Candidatus Zixiibacteriota bacterium]